MIKRLLIAIAMVVAMSSPALAYHCPKTVKAIDAALPNAKLSADQKAKVKQYRDEGLALHKSKKHKKAVKTLDKGVRIILNNM